LGTSAKWKPESIVWPIALGGRPLGPTRDSGASKERQTDGQTDRQTDRRTGRGFG